MFRYLLGLVFAFSHWSALGADVQAPTLQHLQPNQQKAIPTNPSAYVEFLQNEEQFRKFSSTPLRSELTQALSLKFTIDLRDGKIYYADANTYPLHYEFATKVLGYRANIPLFNATQYLDHPERFLLLGELNYFHKQDVFTLYLSPSTQMNCMEIEHVFARAEHTSFLKDKLVYQIGNAERDVCNFPRTITNDELYKGQVYQSLNPSFSYGYLRKLEAKNLDEAEVGRHDILVLRGIPNDVSVVAGIITTEFQTLLSHLNVLSSGRNTPNMALRGAWDDPQINALENKLVLLTVEPNTYALREASLEEAQEFWDLTAPQETVYLSKNTDLSGLVELNDADYTYTDRIGAKAANFAELLNAGASTPEDYFAVPFYYYEQHMKNSGLDLAVAALLEDPELKADPKRRKEALAELQKRIREAPVDPELVELVRKRLKNFADFPSYRFRSSTNAEDLDIFSGAGLYGSTSAKRDHKKKTIERALKKVWASLWGWRAFEERSYYKIDHASLAIGVLVNRGFPDEDANGVLLTINPFGINPGFIINAAHKEFSIVLPEDGYQNDQILLNTWSLDPTKKFEIEYLSRSNRPDYETPALTDEEILELGRQAMLLKRRYFDKIPHAPNLHFTYFGLEMEFKIDSTTSPRKLYIKQVRPFR